MKAPRDWWLLELLAVLLLIAGLLTGADYAQLRLDAYAAGARRTGHLSLTASPPQPWGPAPAGGLPLAWLDPLLPASGPPVRPPLPACP